uniref:Phospholipase A2 n=1 Tax=Phascolarctos cinereus TaxID=38626 RepID=A0A6P5JCK7_PHACI|nr:basic phospholipase A2 9-like [Phascolarctos cinereus]
MGKILQRCCWEHDCCYQKLEGKHESKIQNYSFTYKAGVVTCNDLNFCKAENCICNKLLAECLKKHVSSFSSEYRGFPHSR